MSEEHTRGLGKDQSTRPSQSPDVAQQPTMRLGTPSRWAGGSGPATRRRGMAPARAGGTGGIRARARAVLNWYVARLRLRRWLTLGLTALILVALLAPGVLAFASAYGDYTSLRALGDDGLAHLLAAKDDFSGLSALAHAFSSSSGSSSTASATQAPYTLLIQRQAGTFYATQISITPGPHLKAQGAKPATYTFTLDHNTTIAYPATTSASTTPTATATATATPKGSGSAGTSTTTSVIPDPTQVRAAQANLQIAEQDFTQLRTRLDHLGWALSGAEALPGMGVRFSSLRALAQVGEDASALGLLATNAALPLLTRLHGQQLGQSLTSGSGLITQADITRLEQAITDATPLVTDLRTQLDSVQVGSLPLSASQQAELRAVQQALPQVQPLLQQAKSDIAAVGWLLGTDAPRNFLVQTLDRSELRATGGFSGDFGILNMSNGKIAPFTLTTVERTDYGYGRWFDGWDLGQRPPSAYDWWPIANWGLRDANLAADFPTNAQMTLSVFANECGSVCQAAGVPNHLDGVIAITPVAIEHLLAVTGPLFVPRYDETVTASNFEQKIHYYQLDPAGQAKQAQLSPNDTDTSQRKAFTGLVGSLLEARLKSLPQSEMLQVVRQMLSDLRAKDIQIYVTNPTLETLLNQQHLAGAVDTTAGQDGFFVVQVNASAAKATPCVTLTEKDNITLDDNGGATHTLTIAMRHAVGACDPWPGEFTTYHAYMRIYAPPQAQLKGADGFDTNQPMCAANCSPNPYPGGEMVCPAGGYLPGAMTYTLAGMGMGDPPGVLDKLGSPTQTTSDVPGRAMWGGWVAIPPNCTQTLTLRYYVPGIVAKGAQAETSGAPLADVGDVSDVGAKP